MPARTALPSPIHRFVVGLTLFASARPLCAQTVAPTDPDPLLTELSLEDLMMVEIETTTAARKPQAVGQTPAAVHVLTADDLRRSGATTLPEALRLVPGLNVARTGSSSWAVSARGFNDLYANKMLVLVDGRSVYTPLFSGTYWDTLDLPLDTVERIEVVLGPGAALWGANAVNGIISIVTKSAASTRGLELSALGGNEDRAQGYARYGDRLGADGSYRVWARYADRDDSRTVGGADLGDAWNALTAGFRMDWGSGERDDFTVDGGLMSLDQEITAPVLTSTPPFGDVVSVNSRPKGGFLRGRWSRELGESSSLDLQASFDHTERVVPTVFGDRRSAFDLDLQHHTRLGESHDVVWGVGYRGSSLEIVEQSFAIGVLDDQHFDSLFSSFVQDDISLVQGLWNLILGAKLEHNDYTGFEFQPSVRTLWNVSESQVGWAAVSRAVRSPSQYEAEGIIPVGVVPGAPPTFLTIMGDDQFRPEELIAYEVGYRNQFSRRAALDVAVFYNVYDDLRSFEPGTPFVQGGSVVVPLLVRNLGAADTWGGEVALDWRVGDCTRVRPSYGLLQIQYRNDPASADTTTGPGEEGSAPQHQASLWINHALTRDWDLDAALFYVDELANGAIPEYWRLDLRAEWRASADLAFVAGAQGLLHDEEPEFGVAFFNTPSTVDSAFYVGLTWSR